MHTEERTFIAVKPDGVQRGLIGEIIKRFETKGYKVIGLKMLQVTDEQARAHYAEHEGKPFYPRLLKYIQSGPIVAMVIQGYNAVAGARHLMGATDHGSDSVESAQREIGIYFNENELFTEGKCMSELVVESLDAEG